MVTIIDQIEKEFVSKVSKLSIMDKLVETIYVDTNPAQIESIELSKSSTGTEVATKVLKQVKLKRHRMIVKKSGGSTMVISDEIASPKTIGSGLVCESISERLNNDFIDVIKSSSIKEKWAFFGQNLIRRLFFRRTNSDLINKIFKFGINSNWIIISNSVYVIIKRSNFFIDNQQESNSIIKNVGQLKLDNLLIDVYLNDEADEKSICFGRYDSISVVFNKNPNISDAKSSTDKRTIILEIDYEFIVKSPVKCLIL